MAYNHGIRINETATAIVPPTRVDTALTVVVGTAPLHLAAKPMGVNKPILVNSYSEAASQVGVSDKWDKYTLSEVMYSQFSLFQVAPAVYINVLDPEKHKKSKNNEEMTLQDNVLTVSDPVMLDTLQVRKSSEAEPLSKGTDYTAAFDDDENLVITMTSPASSVFVTYDYLDPSAVDEDDIIGGVASDGSLKGLELVNQVFPQFGVVPCTIIAPGWSHKPAVAAVMKAKENDISGVFKAISIADADTETIKTYTAISEWKNKNNYTDPQQVLTWPMLSLGGRKFHMSTQLAHLMAITDNKYNQLPYKSPSNESLQADGAVLADGTEVFLTPASGAYLNGQGVVTALNFIGGWKSWGNRTTAYPGTTDPKDTFIPIRRMFNYIENTLITTFWSKIDDPGNRRLITAILNSAQMWLNSLVAQGALLGAKVEFLKEMNPDTDLMDGIVKFKVRFTPPSPAREIVFDTEYDVNNLSTLFE